ncbi:hypothetical protein CF319_g9065 [Tilletia indica]|nr:hypothetical protein CF319_g9065 [Tilletia indica]
MPLQPTQPVAAPPSSSLSPRSQRVKSDLKAGLSLRAIARTRGVSKSWVGNLRSQLENLPPPPPSGRPPVLSPQDRRRITRPIVSGRLENAVEVHREFTRSDGRKCSATTVRRVLKDAGFKARVKKKKPAITDAHAKARLAWARQHRAWTASDWEKVIWSDETKINRFGSDGRKWVWVPKGSALTNREVTPTHKFGGGGVMVWGCITASSVGGMTFIQGIMDSEKYVEILQSRLFPTLDALDLVGDPNQRQQRIFQHDNDPKHTSRHTKAWLAQHNLTVLDWPAQSPDLNPIEHVWRKLKEQLKTYPTPAANLQQLKDRIQEQWDLIPADYIQRLVASMPARVEAVIKAKGRNTKY